MKLRQIIFKSLPSSYYYISYNPPHPLMNEEANQKEISFGAKPLVVRKLKERRCTSFFLSFILSFPHFHCRPFSYLKSVLSTLVSTPFCYQITSGQTGVKGLIAPQNKQTKKKIFGLSEGLRRHLWGTAGRPDPGFTSVSSSLLSIGSVWLSQCQV